MPCRTYMALQRRDRSRLRGTRYVFPPDGPRCADSTLVWAPQGFSLWLASWSVWILPLLRRRQTERHHNFRYDPVRRVFTEIK